MTTPPVRYTEPARSYLSTVGLGALIVAGFVVDLAQGGAWTHVVGWVGAALIIVGIDGFVVHTARRLRSITVTDDEIRVGADGLSRTAIVAVDTDPARVVARPVLGRRPGEGLPRGAAGLVVVLTGGGSVVVPTRHPQRLADVLALPAAGPEIRPAEPAELDGLPELQVRAGVLFAVAGLDLPENPVAVDEFHSARAVLVTGRPPVGFARIEEVDGLAHLDQLSVLPSAMRRGLGSALLTAVCDWAREQGYPAVTLITFADVRFNGPFYAARGFVPIDDLTPELAGLRDRERDLGLDRVGRRVVMRRTV